MKSSISVHPAPRTEAGLTLVELMVATTISLIVMLVMASLLFTTSRTNSELARTNSQIENGRFAIQLLASDIALAGFWANHIPTYDDLALNTVPGDVPQDVPAPCLAFDPATWTAGHKNNLIGIPLQVYEDVPAGCEDVITDKRPDTDILLVRHAQTCVPGEANCEADVAGALYFQPSACDSEIKDGQRFVLDTADFTLTRRDCTTPAPKRKFVSSIYYIRDYAVTEGDGIPTLMRSQFDLASGALAHQLPVPLIEGIEGFKVELGIDNLSDSGAAVDFTQAVDWADETTKDSPTNRGDGILDQFLRCPGAGSCSAAQLTNAVAARVHLLVRSTDASPGYTDGKTYQLAGTDFGPYNDGFLRRVFSTTVRLVNLSGRRETP